ncbi:uncharacterized membrane protein (UPF0182 family) [Arthrobacter globiformis]|uniref:UPF0182 family membrane protein n=1 Tax=Arthrobacter globiformis TaxID=1665 RepID=UPI002785E9F2|nr:UPF0182 family protein [Arthrobacter globiformis]MDQ1059430.1 uncharacterized membrane protein (UPF0182 family) [Arthrobacter globiformis]
MSRPASPTPPGKLQTRRGALTPTLIVVALVVVGFIFFANVWTDVLWYQQLGYFEVFLTENLARIGIFATGFLIMFAAVFYAIRIAYHARPVYAPDSEIRDNLNRYQAQLEPVRRVVMTGLPVLFGLFAGSAASSQWQKVMLFFNQESFGQKDPEFGLDIGFYLMTLPFLGFVTGFLISVAIVAGIAGILTHYLYGSIRIMERGIFTSRAAQIHLAVTGASFLILLGINFWLDRYSALQNSGGRWAGALYTDVNAVIPTKAILAVAAALVAILFIVAAIIGKWRLPVIGTAMLVITSILAGGVYPWVIQQFQVRPSEQTLERKYIERNIGMTRAAYGLDQVKVERYNATTTTTAGALAPDAQTTANIRLLDPNLISDAFSQLEQFRPYYQFPKALNVDRYMVDGKVQDTVIAVRELNPDGLSADQQSWLNRHVVYTHGYGVVAAKGNKFTADGKPEFLQSGIPSTGVLGNDETYEPRIYFGEDSPEYSIVGAPEGAPHREQDRPASKEGGETQYTFTGNGGPNVGSFFNKVLYSIKFQSSDLLLSDGVNDASQILYERNPRERVQKVAPYLTVDGNAYPAVVDGRVKWIVDGYTTSQYYPYSQQEQLSDATTDSQTTAGRNVALPNSSVNYIRNSVKATVDAYDGSVTLYAWDEQDPLLKAWQKVFPSTLKPYSEMSAAVMSHVRYPEDLFKVQRELLGRYHVTDPVSFYKNDDAWSVPNDPTVSQEVKQPPFYMSLQMPDQKTPAFQLTSSYIPQVVNNNARNVLYGFLAADSDAGSKKGVKADSYGQLRLLQVPPEAQVPGPGQAQNKFNSDPAVSQALNLLRQGASDVLNGNLLTLPAARGMLYIQPVYLKSTGETSYPTLQRVLVAFGDKIGFAPTLDEALNQLFGGRSGAQAGDSPNNGKTPTTPGGGTTPPPTGSADAKAALKAALDEANAAIKAGQEALAKGDFAAYGEQQKKLSAALKKALDAEARLGTGTASSPTSPSATPTPSPSS